MPEREIIRHALHEALAKLVKEDDLLLSLGLSGVHELAHVHRFAVYLERRLESQLADRGLTIDMDCHYHEQHKKAFAETPWLARVFDSARQHPVMPHSVKLGGCRSGRHPAIRAARFLLAG